MPPFRKTGDDAEFVLPKYNNFDFSGLSFIYQPIQSLLQISSNYRRARKDGATIAISSAYSRHDLNIKGP
jgi:hypothetical protein